MIYSATNDNWERVKIMHSVAREFLDETRGSGFRRRIIDGKRIFPFDASSHDSMTKESQIVGMLMAWSVITVESLINHLLAETINNTASAVMAIEYPNQIIGKFKIAKSVKSELSKKVIILSNTLEPSSAVLKACDELSDTRNAVVHDKPFELYERGDDDVEVNYLRTRGENKHETVRYDALVQFFRKCDQVVNYVRMFSDDTSYEIDEIDFSSLLESC